MDMNSILVIGAHPDDFEIMAGGILARKRENDSKTYALVMTDGELGGDPEVRREEAKRAGEILGVEKVFFLGLPDGEINQGLSPIHAIEEVIEETDPETIITHFSEDTHQDHRNTYHATMSAARKHRRVLLGETPSTLAPPAGYLYVDITDTIQKKEKAMKAHKSQFDNDRGEKIVEYIKNIASTRGHNVGVDYAEALWIHRFLM